METIESSDDCIKKLGIDLDNNHYIDTIKNQIRELYKRGENINSIHKKLSLIYHPDKNRKVTERKQVLHPPVSYDILSCLTRNIDWMQSPDDSNEYKERQLSIRNTNNTNNRAASIIFNPRNMDGYMAARTAEINAAEEIKRKKEQELQDSLAPMNRIISANNNEISSLLRDVRDQTIDEQTGRQKIEELAENNYYKERQMDKIFRENADQQYIVIDGEPHWNRFYRNNPFVNNPAYNNTTDSKTISMEKIREYLYNSTPGEREAKSQRDAVTVAKNKAGEQARLKSIAERHAKEDREQQRKEYLRIGNRGGKTRAKRANKNKLSKKRSANKKTKTKSKKTNGSKKNRR